MDDVLKSKAHRSQHYLVNEKAIPYTKLLNLFGEDRLSSMIERKLYLYVGKDTNGVEYLIHCDDDK